MKYIEEVVSILSALVVGFCVGAAAVTFYIWANSACFGPHKRGCVFIYDAGKFFTLF